MQLNKHELQKYISGMRPDLRGGVIAQMLDAGVLDGVIESDAGRAVLGKVVDRMTETLKNLTGILVGGDFENRYDEAVALSHRYHASHQLVCDLALTLAEGNARMAEMKRIK